MLELYKTDFEFDAVGAMVKVEWWWDSDKEAMMSREVQDIDPILQTNQNQYNDTDERARYKSETLNKMASIPMLAFQEIQKETGINILNADKKELKKVLNDRDFRKLRTRPGRI